MSMARSHQESTKSKDKCFEWLQGPSEVLRLRFWSIWKSRKMTVIMGQWPELFASSNAMNLWSDHTKRRAMTVSCWENSWIANQTVGFCTKSKTNTKITKMSFLVWPETSSTLTPYYSLSLYKIKLYELSPAETRLTVYRRRQVRPNKKRHFE